MEDNLLLRVIAYDILILIGILIALLIVLYVYSNKKIKKLQTKLDEQTGTTIPQFFAREIQITKHFLEKEQQRKPQREGISFNLKMRKKFLTTEKSHLIKEGASSSDINGINKSIAQYKALFNALSKSAPNTSSNKTIHINKEINKLRENISQQQKLIEKLRKHIEQQGNKKSETLTEKYTEESELEAQSIDLIKSSLSEAQKIYQRIVVRQNEIKPSESSDDSDLTFKQILADFKEKYTSAIKQIEKLNSSNSTKRKIIIDLESQFSSMTKAIETENKDEPGPNELKSVIEQLKLQLRDSEMCTAVLETQTEELRLQLENSQKPQINSKELSIKIQDEFSHLVMEGIRNLTTVTSMKDIENIISPTINELEITGGLLITIKGQDEVVSILDDSISQTLVTTIKDNFHANRNESNIVSNISWQELPQGVLLNLKNCCFFIKGGSINGDIDLITLAKLFVVASSVVERLDALENDAKAAKLPVSVAEKAKNTIKTMDAKNKKLSSEVNQLVATFTTDIDDFLSKLQLTELQLEMLKDLEEEFKDRFELLFMSENTMDESFVELINLLNQSSD